MRLRSNINFNHLIVVNYKTPLKITYDWINQIFKFSLLKKYNFEKLNENIGIEILFEI